MKAPFPWFGGKRLIAPVVWDLLGDPVVYCEPFAGSLAVLLARAWSPNSPRVETVNDKDGFVCNAWRAILHDPEGTAERADWPTNENDLHARHAWLVTQREALTAKLEGDPEYYDAKVAGWWLWGIAQWIGCGWCSGDGPWSQVDGKLVHLSNTGQGVSRKRVHLSNTGRGVSRRRVHLSTAGRGSAGDGEHGLLAWLVALSDRLRGVRVCSGDWRRVLSPAAMALVVPGVRGIFLDPPYSAEADRTEYYAVDDLQVAHAVRAWCLEHGSRRDYRIVLCGYEGEGHEELERADWGVVAWHAQGGMQRDKTGGNRMRERLWYSPACRAARRQLGLFEAAAE